MKNGDKHIPTLPIIIDDIKRYDGLHITRCNYFSIEADDPTAGWVLNIGDELLPFLMIGLQGVIFKAINESGIFRTPDDIEDLFNLIEKNTDNLYIDINHLWIPSSLFYEDYHSIGQTLRITHTLFRLSYRYDQQQLTMPEFINECENLENPIVYEYSEVETKAFRSWEKEQIEQAVTNYHENESMALAYTE